jgi:hypothetical protein
MKDDFKAEANELQMEVNLHKQKLAGLDDTVVKGFDVEMEGGLGEDDSIDKLDIYSKFLGEGEYLKMKENYHKALATMSQLNDLERERM